MKATLTLNEKEIAKACIEFVENNSTALQEISASDVKAKFTHGAVSGSVEVELTWEEGDLTE